MQIETPTSRSARDRGLGDSFVLRKPVGRANHAHLHVLRREATTPDMPHPQPRGLQEATGSVWINHWERHETDEFLEIGAYQEIEYRLRSLRALVCDLLKTNQELRSALLDAGIDMPGREEMRKHD